MQPQAPSPETTLAIVLGARESPSWPELETADAFAHSARTFEEYLKSSRGLGLPQRNIKNLFDSPGAPSAITRAIREFLQQRQQELRSNGRPATDLLLYHVGHGDFLGERQAYHLILHDSDKQDKETTSLAITALADILREHARGLRKYLILDACFAAAAVPQFQSADGAEIKKQTLAAFPPAQEQPGQGPAAGAAPSDLPLPSSGVALLCSSSKDRRSYAPPGQRHTLFTGALLDVLERGITNGPPRLTLRLVGEEVV